MLLLCATMMSWYSGWVAVSWVVWATPSSLTFSKYSSWVSTFTQTTSPTKDHSFYPFLLVLDNFSKPLESLLHLSRQSFFYFINTFFNLSIIRFASLCRIRRSGISSEFFFHQFKIRGEGIFKKVKSSVVYFLI